MTFMRRIFSGFAGIVMAALVLGLMSSQVVFAQDSTSDKQDPTAGYSQIIEEGIIFGNMNDVYVDKDNDIKLCRDMGKCSLDQILQIFVNIVTFILGISGSVVLLMFVYGGFMWVTSRGEAKHVQTGKDAMVRSLIGFTIIVLSYSLINFLVAAVVGDNPFDGDSLPQTIDDAVDKKADYNPPAQESTLDPTLTGERDDALEDAIKSGL
jgi:hypothetical protein